MGNIFFRDSVLNDTYGGRDLLKLGKTVQSVATQVSKNDFSDLYIGDYFPITMYSKTVNWHIAHFNYFLNVGDTSFTKPHLVLVNDIPILYKHMNPTDTTVGGYIESDMRKNTLPEILGVLNTTDFKSHILTHRDLFANSMDPNSKSGGCPAWSGCTNSWGWHDSTLELLTEPQVYGTTIFSSSGYDIGTGDTQFAIFKLNKQFLNIDRQWWWLRAIAYSACFCSVHGGGAAGALVASFAGGVRIYFCFG